MLARTEEECDWEAAAAAAVHRPQVGAGAVETVQRWAPAVEEEEEEDQHLSRPVRRVAEVVRGRLPYLRPVLELPQAEEGVSRPLWILEGEVPAEQDLKTPRAAVLVVEDQRPLRGAVLAAGDPRTPWGAVLVAGDPR